MVACSTTVASSQAPTVTFTHLIPTWTYFVRVVASGDRSAVNSWPVDADHQRTSTRLNRWKWSIVPS